MAGLLCKNRALFAQSSSMMSLAARNGSGSAVPLPPTLLKAIFLAIISLGQISSGKTEISNIGQIGHPQLCF